MTAFHVGRPKADQSALTYQGR